LLVDHIRRKELEQAYLEFIANLPVPEIAKHFGISLSSVEKYIAMALHHCYVASLHSI
jgi:DNA-directed RNA polymerase specialized sigma24 family protein